MPIQLTTLKGTNSIASDRITLNDNFEILKDNLNDLLDLLSTDTGNLDISSLSGGTILSNSITITEDSNLDLIKGDIKLTDGKINLNGYFISRKQVGSANLIETENFDGIKVPKKDANGVTALQTELVNSTSTVADRDNVIVFDTSTNKFKGFNGTTFVDLH